MCGSIVLPESLDVDAWCTTEDLVERYKIFSHLEEQPQCQDCVSYFYR